MGWTLQTLKEYFERMFEERAKALDAALIAVKEENRKTEAAAERRFELLNELRSGVATKDQLEALEKVVDDLKTSRDTGQGKGDGLHAGWMLLLGGVSLIGGVLAIVYSLLK